MPEAEKPVIIAKIIQSRSAKILADHLIPEFINVVAQCRIRTSFNPYVYRYGTRCYFDLRVFTIFIYGYGLHATSGIKDLAILIPGYW
jgi:hypothetical protein